MEMKENAIREDEAKIIELLEKTIKVHLQSLEQQKLNFQSLQQEVKDNTEMVEKLAAKIEDKISSAASQIADAVVQTLKSAKDVDRKVLERFKKVKLYHNK